MLFAPRWNRLDINLFPQNFNDTVYLKKTRRFYYQSETTCTVRVLPLLQTNGHLLVQKVTKIIDGL